MDHQSEIRRGATPAAPSTSNSVDNVGSQQDAYKCRRTNGELMTSAHIAEPPEGSFTTPTGTRHPQDDIRHRLLSPHGRCAHRYDGQNVDTSLVVWDTPMSRRVAHENDHRVVV